MTIQLLPQACATGVAFTSEPIAMWTASGDLARFLCEGVLLESPDNHYGAALFNEGWERYLKRASEFHENALRNPDSMASLKDDVPSFTTDPSFGWMAKHAVAFDGLLNAILSDGAFVSLSHILETDSDLECSVLLASRMYYKQALQSLRGALEMSVAHVHFATHPDDFQLWVNGVWNLPRMRGRGWLLATLKAEGALSEDIDEQVSELYGLLNGSVHSSEIRLIHSGLPKGRWAGLQFKRQQFDDWCSCYARTVAVSLRLLAQMLANHLAAPKPEGIVCDTCRRQNDYDVVSHDCRHVTLRCRQCTSEQTFDAEYASKHGY